MKHIIRLFKFAKPWSKYLVAATIALLATTSINLLVPYIIGEIISIMEQGDFSEYLSSIITLGLILLGCYFLRAFTQFFSEYLSHVASWRLVARIRSVIYDHLQKLSMSYYSNKQTGQLMSRVVNDTNQFESLIAHAIPEVITNILTLVGVLVILLFINPWLALLVCAPIPLISLMIFILRKMRKYFKVAQEELADLNAILQDNFSGIKEIQIFNKQKHEFERVDKKSAAYSESILHALFLVGILHPFVAFTTSIGTVIVLIAGPIIAIRYGLDIADVVRFLLYLNLLYAPISALTRTAENIQQALAGAERVFEVLDTEPDIKDRPDSVEVQKLSGQIELKNVSFAYEDEIPVLDNISFVADPGEMIALVGPTGVGKTTISGLIARFHDPKSGSILMDGIDIKDMTLESLRKNLSVVLQDVFLFNGTITDNITYGCPGATKDKIEKATKAACIDKFIESLPDGYNTIVGERGVKLSGGQKQRISIARSILRNSPFLILDEATSAVDTETEREVQNAINQIAGTRTLIVIAHRLSTIRKADKIIVLENGKIVEMGNHNKLLEENGAYAALCNSQSLG
ncbi:MAG: ABC transporter ATP-binding protein/permease [Defluviitaleaceae bacterium]|nr:ABC transporter ATP-binding protein/permease [Defluviitaleaceae bacterium]